MTESCFKLRRAQATGFWAMADEPHSFIDTHPDWQVEGFQEDEPDCDDSSHDDDLYDSLLDEDMQRLQEQNRLAGVESPNTKKRKRKIKQVDNALPQPKRRRTAYMFYVQVQ